MKKVKKMNPLLFRLGFAFSILGLMACAGSLDENPDIDAEDGNWIKVRVAIPAEDEDPLRKLDKPIVKTGIDFYEVIFKDSNHQCYYGTGDGTDYVSVTVPVGTKYQVLMLAGVRSSKVLLASAYVKSFDVKRGIKNVVPFTALTQVLFDPVKDFKVYYDDAQTTALPVNRTNTYSVTTVALDKSSSVTGTAPLFALKIPMKPLGALITAHYNPGDPLITEGFMNLKWVSKEPSDVPDISQTVFTLSGTTANDALLFTVPKTEMPDRDVSGKLYFELDYYGFSLPNPKTRLWRIRSGLDYNWEKDNSGSGLWVKVGTGGTVDFGLDLVDVDVDPSKPGLK